MRLIIILSCLFYSAGMIAQDYNVKVFTSNDGLPITCMSTVSFDNRNYLWVGTPSGFSRFDGRSFTNYGIREGLKESNAGFIVEDDQHRVWGTTVNHVYLFQNNKFTEVPVTGFPKLNYLFCFSQLNDGRIVFSCDQGTFTYDGKSFVPFSLYGFPVQTVFRTILALPDGRLIANTTGAVYEKKKDGPWQTLFENAPAKMPSVFYTIEHEGKVYFTTEAGVYEITGHQNVKLLYKGNPDSSQVIRCFIDRRKNLWVITSASSLYMVNPKGEIKRFGKEYGIDNYPMSEITEDKWGNIWVSSYQGLIRLTPSFICSVFPPGNPQRIFRKVFRCNGFVYLFGGDKCIYRFKDGKEYPFPARLEEKIRSLMNFKQAVSIAGGPDEKIWFSTNYGELFELSRDDFREIKIPVLIWKIIFINDELLLSGKNYLYTLKNNKLDKKDSLASGEPFTWINFLQNENKDNAWMSYKENIYLYKNDSLVNMSTRLNIPPFNYEQAINHGEEVWVITDKNGIIRIKKRKDQSYQLLPALNSENGLASDVILSASFDSFNNLWYTTTKGLWWAQLIYNNDSVYAANSRKFTEKEGLDNTIWDTGPLATDYNDDVYVAAINGVFRISPAAVPGDSLPPVIQIEKAELSGSSNDWTNYASQFSPYQNLAIDPTLPYSQNSIRFYFNGITMNQAEEIKYIYRLEGYDKKWSNPSATRTATYTNLPAGNYHFKVIAMNAYGVWSKAPASFDFLIRPPFWQTWWFRFFVAGFLIVVFYFFIRRRERIKQEKNKIALQIAELRLQTLQSQMNPHFIFNSLNSVGKYILENNPAAGARYLSKFSKLIRRILDNSSHNLLPLHQIIETLEMYMELESLRFNREFSYQLKKTDEEDEIMNLRLPPMLLQPFVENAIWHGLMPKEGEKKLLVSIEKKENTLYCMVEDNGVGRSNTPPQTEGHTSRGEKMIRGMMESLQQLLHVKAQIRITDLVNETGQAKGTRVEMYIPLSSSLNNTKNR
jgi:hypothetical protein